jgi:hypothetical protein
LNAQQQRVVRARVLENVAARIERGDVPPVHVREAAEPKPEQQRGWER